MICLCGYWGASAKSKIMKKVLLSAVTLFLMSMLVYGQQEVTKFLGIPVDGSKSEMIRKLKEKGFKSTIGDKEVLIGEFNGTTVNVHVVTNNGKVCRIMLRDVYEVNASNIRIRFNKLCQQFKNNGKYISANLGEDYTILEDENIPYNITVKNKRYEAVFYQVPTAIDSTSLRKEVVSGLLEKYTEEQLANPTEEIQNEILTQGVLYVYKEAMNRPVWFMINSLYGVDFSITMFYDNEYNRANGEDL